MSDRDQVLGVHGAFYAAFASGDMAAMERIWVRDRVVFCTHPGRPPLVGRDDVMASWRAILSAPPPIRIDRPSMAMQGDMAFLLCRETIGISRMTATNILVRAETGWHMVHHHAGPIVGVKPAPPPPATMH